RRASARTGYLRLADLRGRRPHGRDRLRRQRTVTGSLRVVADDVGQSAAIDDGVAELARAGHLSAASVLVRARGARAAMAALAGLVPLGVHVQLEPDELAGGTAEQVTALIVAQVEAMLAAGHSPAHLDLHTSALYGLGPDAVRPGGVLMEAIAVAARHRLRLRLPRGAPAGLDQQQTALHARAVAAADAAGLVLPDVLVTEVPEAAAVADFLAALPEGEVELVTHPALRADPGDRLGPERVRQHALLASGVLQPR